MKLLHLRFSDFGSLLLGSIYLLHVLVEAPISGLTKAIFYTPRGEKPWYARFNIELKLNGNGSRKSSGTMSESQKKSVLSPTYAAGVNEEKKMAFENPVDAYDETQMEETDGTDLSTALL